MATDKADKVLAAASGHSLVSGVLSLAGGSDSPSEAQDLMPEITEQREDKMLTRPQGVLAVHIKQVRFRTRHFASCASIGVYLHLHVFGKTRATAVYNNVQFPSTIAFDDIKHFSVTPNPKHYDEENQIRLELIGYDRPDVHQIIAWRYIHIYDIIKKMYVADKYKMVSKEDKTAGEVEIEYCFAYGQMGYGTSNQLGNNMARPRDLISHSMFARPAPPIGRQIDEDTDVMNCIPIGPPNFVDFPERSQTSYKKEYAPISTNENFVIDPMMLQKRIRRRMLSHQEELDSLKTRKERLRFIRNLSNPNALNHPFDSDEFMVPNQLRLKEYDGSQLNAFNQVVRPPTAASEYEEATNLSEMDDILEQAPGVKSMRRPRARAAIVPSFSDYSFGSGGTSESETDRVPSFCEWLTALLCRPFRRRNPVVVSAQPEQSEMSYMSHEVKSMKSVHTYYSADLNVLTQDRTDPVFEETPSDEDPSQDLVRQRILEANTLLESSEIEEYHENRGFQESKGDLEAAARQRKPVPNVF